MEDVRPVHTAESAVGSVAATHTAAVAESAVGSVVAESADSAPTAMPTPADTSSPMIELSIDGRSCTCVQGEFIYDIAKRNDIFIPTLCRHGGLEHRGACRICIVEVEEAGHRKVVTSCIYPVERPCAVFTDTARIREERATILTLLSACAPAADRIAQLVRSYDVEVPGRLVSREAQRCILCGLCMQACEQMGTGAIALMQRGVEREMDTPFGEPSPVCVGCASCAEVCPTQAIECVQDDAKGIRTIWGKTFELIRCERCGELLGTREEYARVAERVETGEYTCGVDAPEAEVGAGEGATHRAALCDACRRQTVADALPKQER